MRGAAERDGVLEWPFLFRLPRFRLSIDRILS